MRSRHDTRFFPLGLCRIEAWKRKWDSDRLCPNAFRALQVQSRTNVGPERALFDGLAPKPLSEKDFEVFDKSECNVRKGASTRYKPLQNDTRTTTFVRGALRVNLIEFVRYSVITYLHAFLRIMSNLLRNAPSVMNPSACCRRHADSATALPAFEPSST